MPRRSTLLLIAALFLLPIGCRRPEPSAPNPQGNPTQEPQASKPAAHPSPAPEPKPAAERSTPGKTLYLTFDADMTPGMLAREKQHKVARWYSPGLVDYLLQNKIPATIFSTGMFAEDYPELIAQLAASGQFSIQNHTYDHAAFASPCYGLPVVTTDEAKTREMTEASEVLTRLAGHAPVYLRHPGLCHKPHDDQLAAQLGLKLSDTGTVSGDAFAHNPQLVAESILHGAPRNPVIILHLGGPNAPATEEAIKIAVPQLLAKGYTFAMLP